jgi:hypothetical protein
MTTREIKAWDKARAKALKLAKADLKKSDGWRLREFSKMYAYDMDFKMKNDNIEKFVFLCESHHGFCEVWTWTVEVDIDLRKKAVIVDRNVREVK